jgi:hypothetical protein
VCQEKGWCPGVKLKWQTKKIKCKREKMFG